MSPLLILFILTALIGLTGIGAAIVLSVRLQRLKLQLHNERKALAPAPAASDADAGFQVPLLQATLRQRLRQHQPQRPAPDKYRMASELAAQGLTAQQIADLLSLPPAEVRQLVSLSRAGRTIASIDSCAKEISMAGR